MYGYEISWQFVDKDTMAIACEGGHYASNIEATKTCDLKPGVMYELKCEDEWGDGWNGGYIEIAGLKYCDNFDFNSPCMCGGLCTSPCMCAGYYEYGCNTLMEISIKVSGTIVIYLSRNFIHDLFS